MGRHRWATYGYDKARANMHILKTTGKYGQLETPDEVWDYLPKITQPLLHNPDNVQKQQPERPCAVKSGRLVAVKDGTANIYQVTPDGRAGALLEAKTVDSKQNGRAWRCVDCKKPFTTWADFVDHSLKAKAEFDKATNGNDTIDESARAATPDDSSRSNPMTGVADTHDENHTTTPDTAKPTTDTSGDPGGRPGPSSSKRTGSERTEGPDAEVADGANPDAAAADRPEDREPAADAGAAQDKGAGSPAARRNDQAKGRRTASKSRGKRAGATRGN